MYLKSIELHGFKSFPDKTVLNFEKGVTVVVGPNGSGKSNISDAMRWVLGETSTRTIRGTKMEDVVFAGSGTRSPMGYAEVSVTFDNSGADGRRNYAVENEEITVTRRYYRVGESEYFINRKPCRLRDIHELFLNTGLGKEGYSIIGQGKISEIVSKKDEERRAVFEEAAGIAKYKYQEAEAQKKLSGTEDNLVRTVDKLTDLEERIGPLQADSEKAKKYLELAGEKREIDVAMSLFEIGEMSEKTDKLYTSMTISRQSLDEATAEGQSLDKRIDELYYKTENGKLGVERLIDEISEITGKINGLDGDKRVAENDIKHYGEERAKRASDLASVREKLTAAENETAGFESKLREAGKKVAELNKRKDDMTFELEATEVERSAAVSEAESAGRDIESVSNEIVDAKIALSATKADTEADMARISALQSDEEKLNADSALMRSRIDAAEKVTAKYRARIEELDKTLSVTDGQRAKLREEAEELNREKDENQLSISVKKHQIANIKRLEELYEGYSHAVAFVMKEYAAGKIKEFDPYSDIEICGVLSRLVTVDDKYVAAIETALGASLQNIVVKNEATAKTVIKYLKKKNAGRATFYPLDTMKGSDLDDARFKNFDGYVGVASTLVGFDERYSNVVRYLLGRTLVAENIDLAARIAKSAEYRYKVVTLDGQVINAGGSFMGGSMRQDSGILTRKTQLSNLEAEIASCEKKIAALDAEITKRKDGDGKLNAETVKLQNARSLTARMLEAENTQLQVLKNSFETNEQMLADIRDELPKLRDKLKKSNESIYNAEQIRERLTSKTDELRKKRETALKISEQSAESIEKLRDEIARNDIDAAKAQKDEEICRTWLSEARSREAALKENLGEASEAALRLENRIAELEAKITETAESIVKLETRKAEAEKERADLSEEIKTYEAENARLRGKSKELASKREILFREFTKVEAEYNSVSEKRDAPIRFLFDEYGLSVSDAENAGYPPITAENRAERAARQNQLKNRIRALGNVNVGAVEEYREVSEKYEFLKTQVDDLNKSKEELLSIIGELRSRMKEDFVGAIEEINVRFGKVFSELFNGGHAEIRLSDPDNVLECGIEIAVAPPGKVIKSLSLLSGGEQAFVGIALYFAILEVNPTPFCIFDEIDSALDVANVDRFAAYIKKYSDKTQFILIKHR
ncbi:MAG: chromosome segregation protein SMC, partial [Clostridia bacterium]|nr:chromosome segregation protein SMC [Clostridia bacterium]